jgi:hypothetical protein
MFPILHDACMFIWFTCSGQWSSEGTNRSRKTCRLGCSDTCRDTGLLADDASSANSSARIRHRALARRPLAMLGDSARYRQRHKPVARRHSPFSGTRRATDSATSRSPDLTTRHARGLCALQTTPQAGRPTSLLATTRLSPPCRPCPPRRHHSPCYRLNAA